MTLTLEIINADSLDFGVEPRKVFRSTGGVLGRLPQNDWYLPNELVSKRHAVIRYANGAFSIEDTGQNGTFLNSNQNRLDPGVGHPLKSGDLVIIEPYEIRVQIDPAEVRPAVPVGRESPFDAETFPPPVTFKKAQGGGGGAHQVVSGLNASFQIRKADDRSKPVPIEIPTDWNSGSPEPTPEPPVRDPTPLPPVVSPPAPPASGQVLDLATVLRVAGLDSPVASAEVARDFGHILRIVVGGVMEVLKARQQVKGEFRVEITTFRSAENNPLKFSVDVQDALHNLLVKRHPKYLGPVDAFEDAFGDIRAHEVAMLAGMRAAFEAMLARFDPTTLQEEFDRQLKKNALVAVPGRLRYWDLYCEKIHDMVRDPETSFRDLFGDEFAKAYEEQLIRLKARRRDAPS